MSFCVFHIFCEHVCGSWKETRPTKARTKWEKFRCPSTWQLVSLLDHTVWFMQQGLYFVNTSLCLTLNRNNSLIKCPETKRQLICNCFKVIHWIKNFNKKSNVNDKKSHHLLSSSSKRTHTFFHVVHLLADVYCLSNQKWSFYDGLHLWLRFG